MSDPRGTGTGLPPRRGLQTFIENDDSRGLIEFLASLSPIESAANVSRLSEESRARLLTMLDPDEAAMIVEQIPEVQAIEAVEGLQPHVAAAILQELPAEHCADLLGDVEDSVAEAILDEMESRDAVAMRALRAYEDDVAGGLMTFEYLAYSDRNTVGEALADLRAQAETYRNFVVQYAFVINDHHELVGVLRLRDLIFSTPDTPLRQIMNADPLTIRDTTGLDEVRAFFDANDFHGAPVVDADDRLVGLIHRASVREALAERSESDYLKTQGIIGGEELRTMPLFRRAWRRLSWLSINIVLNVLAASVIALNQEILVAVVALAIFLPIISDMSGCSGNQAVAVSMRELSLGLVRPREVFRVLSKELAVGLINGTALGVLLAAVAWGWQGNPWLGAVVGVALMVNTMIAVSIGGAAPLVLRRLGVDPATASGPVLTTVTDICGFLLLLGLARAALPLLVP